MVTPLARLVLFTAIGMQQGAAQPRDPGGAQVKGTGSISGRVTAADTGMPMRRARVTLFTQRRTTYTDHEGRYRFDELPAGRYTVSASPGMHRESYQALSYGSVISSGTSVPEVKPIELGNGQHLENIDIALPRSAVITGTVLDTDGQPLSHIMVTALLMRPGAQPTQGGGASTDDRGVYRIFTLPPGDYVIRVNPSVGGSRSSIDAEPIGYAPTYAPGTPVIGEAMRVRLAQGSEVVVDVRLMESRLFRISGILLNSKGEAGRSGSVILARFNEAGSSNLGASVSPTGEFTFRNVPPGTYELVGRYIPPPQPGASPMRAAAEGQEYVSLPLEVGSADLENVLITTRPGATVRGRLVFEGAVAEGRRANVFVQNPSRRHYMTSPQVEVSADTFTLKNVFTPILLRGSLGGSGWGLKAVMLRGRDITDVPTTFTREDSGHLQIVFTSTAPSLEASVRNHLGQPVTEATILLFGEDQATWGTHSSYFRRAGLLPESKDGKVTFVGLREGRYFAVAVPPEMAAGIDQPTVEFLESLSKVAARVVLNPGETRTIDLPLVSFER